jgi:putative DNA primase/helicase
MNARLPPPSRDPWAPGVRAADVPIVKRDLSKTRFPLELTDKHDPYAYYASEPNNDQRRAGIDFGEVRTAARNNIDEILRELLPDGKKKGNEWVALNPTRNDKSPGSFRVNTETGVWYDHATTEGGDLIRLWTYVKRLNSDTDAFFAIADFLRVPPRGSTHSSEARAERSFDKASSIDKRASGTAGPAESRIPPEIFPPRTLPDEKGKPKFIVAGDEGPLPNSDEKRRHVYRQGGVPVRIKII